MPHLRLCQKIREQSWSQMEVSSPNALLFRQSSLTLLELLTQLELSLITHFRHQNVPPPMCSTSLRLYPQLPPNPRRIRQAPRSFALAPHKDLLAVLHTDDHTVVWDLSQTTISSKGAVSRSPPILVWEGKLNQEASQSPSITRQIAIWRRQSFSENVSVEDDWCIAVIGSDVSSNQDRIYLDLGKEGFRKRESILSEESNGRLFVSQRGCFCMNRDGTILRGISFTIPIPQTKNHPFICHFPFVVDVEIGHLRPTNIQLPAFCLEIAVIRDDSSCLAIVGLSQSGKLFLASAFESSPTSPSIKHTAQDSIGSKQIIFTLADSASSFTLTPSFVVYTTTSHEAHFVPVQRALDILFTSSLNSPDSILPSSDLPSSLLENVDKRKVERGSKIVVAIPSTMSLVLQMPRGNLETICPRAFVLEIVRSDVTKYVLLSAYLLTGRNLVY